MLVIVKVYLLITRCWLFYMVWCILEWVRLCQWRQAYARQDTEPTVQTKRDNGFFLRLIY